MPSVSANLDFGALSTEDIKNEGEKCGILFSNVFCLSAYVL